jgi:hypothetical protein
VGCLQRRRQPIQFDVTDDFGGAIDYGWVVVREDEQESGDVSFHSFDNLVSADVAPRLIKTVCPPGTTCGETLVTIENGQNGDFFVAAAEDGARIVELDVDENQIGTLFDSNDDVVDPADYPDELIFSLQRVVDAAGDDLKCLGIPDPSIEVGPCWEAEITDPATGDEFDVKFKDPQLFAACVLPSADPSIRETALADVVRQVRRAEFDPTADQPDANNPESELPDPLTILKSAAPADEIPLDCDVFEQQGHLDHMNPVFRLARALWNRITRQVTPRPLQASTMVTTLGHHRGTTTEFPEASVLSWAALYGPYLSGGWSYMTVGRKCDNCDADRVPRKWFEEGFDDSGWNEGGIAAFGDVSSCGLAGSVATNWPSANPNFNPPAITELLLRKSFSLLPFTGDADHPGQVNLEIRAAVHNDIQVYLNGSDVTEFVIWPEGVNLKKDKGWIKSDDDCPMYDQVIVQVPEDLARFGGTNLLAIRARSRDLNPSFLDVQINVIEVTVEE